MRIFDDLCVGVLRDRPYGTLARRQAQADEETRHEGSCVFGWRAGGRAARRDVSEVGGGKEWRPPRGAA